MALAPLAGALGRFAQDSGIAGFLTLLRFRSLLRNAGGSKQILLESQAGDQRKLLLCFRGHGSPRCWRRSYGGWPELPGWAGNPPGLGPGIEM